MGNTITPPAQDTLNKLEELRGALEAESISYGELSELTGLADYIDLDDVQLLEAAGVPEFHFTAEEDGAVCRDNFMCLECRRAAVARG